MSKGWRRARTDYPAGVVAVLDNDGKMTDRYTVVYEPYDLGDGRWFPLCYMSGAPYHPQGVCQHSEARGHRPTAGWGTGNRVIRFEDLPEPCQRVVREDLEEEGED